MSYEHVYPDAVAEKLAAKMNLPLDRARKHVERCGGASSGATPHPRSHYEQIDPVIAEMGEIDALDGDPLFCGGCHGRKGWYRTREHDDGRQGRIWKLGDEFPQMRRQAEREVFGTISFSPDSWFCDGWTGYTFDDDGGGRSWNGDKPLPNYGDVAALAPFADIDLPGELKQKRPTGDAPRETVERALAGYIAAFADLAGGREHVFALDSVGGAYCFVAPTATAPIAAALSGDDREVIIDDMTDQLNRWLEETAAEVIDAVPESEGKFEPDLLNNKNRLFKLPLAAHGDLDGAVTPLDPAAPSYQFTPLSAVDGTVRADAREWARQFTADHTAAVSDVVATLWPEHAADAPDWKAAVRRRVDELHEQQQERNSGTGGTGGGTRHPLDRDGDDDRDVSDIERTDEIADITAAIEEIDAEELAKEVAQNWNTASDRDGPTRLNPEYRSSGSGTSVFVDGDKLVDLNTTGNGGGGPITIVALAEEIIHDAGDTVSGDDYWRAVQALR